VVKKTDVTKSPTIVLLCYSHGDRNNMYSGCMDTITMPFAATIATTSPLVAEEGHGQSPNARRIHAAHSLSVCRHEPTPNPPSRCSSSRGYMAGGQIIIVSTVVQQRAK
jgi:hypothetical protein